MERHDLEEMLESSDTVIMPRELRPEPDSPDSDDQDRREVSEYAQEN